MNFNFTLFPVLKTERLILRQANFDDVEVIFELRSSEEINKFVHTKRVKNHEEAKDFVMLCNELYKEKKRIFWLIEFKNEVIGSIVLHKISLENNYSEIGYKLKPNYHQKGFMSEAIQEIINFGFTNLQLKTIEAFTHKNNIASIALLEKHNFVFQPERKDEGFDNNRIFKLEN
ncbi:GNAT family N-acetyltransferase [Polaribacter sp. Hel1_85]|uniref:GNAT family N-acetyltransferase n=1 Tax=Polaribacter sp. Hel1_85 TaxID=1250005 RepID=UPI00052C19AD|nr:GNAT family N-acetyltransferase [Polaribacter sp. Hel1_85]KGL63041.1 acetyltransferase (GNAT) family protein [Polaribacter sp. Hel1_85]